MRQTPARFPAGRRALVIRIGWITTVLIVIGLSVLVALNLNEPRPPELDQIESFASLGVDHLAPGAPTPEYNSDPPTSGPHDSIPAACGIYRQPVPDRSMLHSMEHGAMVISYDPGLTSARRDQIEDIGRSIGDEVIVAPRPGLNATIVLTGWTKLLTLEEIDERAIRGFDAEVSNLSPEAAASCPFQVDEGT